LLARHASGSFRDALGMLEQLETYSGGEISLEDVLAVLGISDSELLFSTLDAIASAEPRAALLAVAAAVDGGRDPAAFIRELEAHARELLVVQTLGGAVPPEIGLTPDHDARLATQAGTLGPAVLVRLLDLLAQALIAVRAGSEARTQLELAAVRAAKPDLDPAAAAINARLERLEGSATKSATSPAARQPSHVEQPATRPPVPPVEASEQQAQSVPAAPPAQQPATSTAPEPNDKTTQAPAQPEDEELAVTAGLAAIPDPTGDALPLTLQALVEAWPAVVATLRSSNAMLGAVIEDAQPVALDGSRLVLAFAADAAFMRKKAEDRASRSALSDAVTKVTGRLLSLDYELRELDDPAEPTTLSADELVRRLKDEFDAEELPAVEEEAN
jgi:DNA polymerase-3 subunit gamma/tau